MKNKNLIYDVDGLVAEAKKNLRNSIIKISIAAVALTLSILAVVFFGSYMLIFIGGIFWRAFPPLCATSGLNKLHLQIIVAPAEK